MASNEEGGFWSKVENQKKDERDARARGDTKPKRRWGRILAFAAGGLVIVVGGLVLLAPTIAGGLAPSLVPGFASGAMNGKAAIESASFSWSGPQQVRGLSVSDSGGKSVATIRDIKVSAGLLGLIFGNLDVGAVTITGIKADIVKSADGKTNVQSLSKPAPAAAPAKASSGGIPAGIKAQLVLKDVEATYTDESAAGGKPLVVAVENFDATASFDSRDDIKLKATGAARGADPAKTGSIAIDAVISSWISKSGEVTADAAKVEATVDIKDLPSALLDALAPGALAGGSFREGLGELANVNIVASGGLDGGKAQVIASATNLKVDAKVSVANNLVTSDAPIKVEISGKGLAGFSPAAKAALKQPNATINALPNASLVIDQLRFALPKDGKPLNLKGSGATVSANLTEITGSVTLQEGQQPQPFRIAPMVATIDAKDIAGTLRLNAATDAQINGNNAGTLNAQVAVEGALDAKGAPAGGLPSNIQGEVSLKGVATAIAQPFVQAFKLNLPEDLGPTLDANIKIASKPGSGTGTPPADIDIVVESANLSVTGGVRYAQDRINSRDGGLRITSRKPASMASRFLDPALGYSLVASRPDARGLVLVVKSFDVPMTAAGKPDASKFAADVDVALEGFSVVPIVGGQAAAPLDIAAMAISLAVGGTSPGGVRGSINSSIWHESVPFTMTGTFDLQSLLANDKDGNFAVTMDRMKPVADIQLKDVPVSIARLGDAGKPLPAGPVLDVVNLLKGVSGDTFSVALGAKGVSGSQGAYDVTVALRSPRVTADVEARGSQQSVDLKTFAARAKVEPETVRSLLTTFAPDIKGAPNLVAASTLTFAVDPISIPFKSDHSLDLASVGQTNIKLTLPGRTLVSGLTRMGPDGKPVDLGVVGVEEFTITASAPVAGLVGSAAPGKRGTTMKMGGTILGGADGSTPIAVLDGDVSTEVSNKMLAGPLTAKVGLTQLNVVAIERIIGQMGKISGAIGDKAKVLLTADMQPPADSATFDFAKATTTVTLGVEAPRLVSDGPLSATLSPESFKLNKPSKFTLTVDPVFANSFLKPAPVAGAPAAEQAVRVREMSPIVVTLDRLNFPFKGAKGAAAVLEAALAMTIDSVDMITADGKPLKLRGTDIGVSSQKGGSAGTPVDFRLLVAQVTAGDNPASKDMALRGTVSGIVDGAGNVDPAKGIVQVQADMPQIPTPLIDAFSTRDGTVVDALGPIAALKLDVQRYPLSGKPIEGTEPPVIAMTATSNRASASLKGTIRDGMFVSIDPFKANVTEVTQQLSGRFIKALPLIGTFEKTAQDQAATLDVTGITAALANDMSRLNADIVFDPGEARFGTSSVFGEILKVANSKTVGQVGRKLQPLKMQVRAGIATYERWEVPVGEFKVFTEGTVNLVNRTLDVVTYVPIGAVSDKAMSGLKLGSGLNSILPGVVEALTEVPFRTTGSMDNPKTSIDAEMVAKNTVKKIDPEKLLKDGLGDLLKPRAPK